MEKLSRSQWMQTPYAKSTANNADGQIEKLLEKYGADGFQFTRGRGPHGRQGVMMRFRIEGRTYRMQVEALDADASDAELLLQAKRAIYWMLKSLLEPVSVFFCKEQALFSFLELPGPDNPTTFEVASPQLGAIQSAEFRLHFQTQPLRLTHQKDAK